MLCLLILKLLTIYNLFLNSKKSTTFLYILLTQSARRNFAGYLKPRGRQITESPRRNGINFASPSMSIDWSTVLTHFPLLGDDKERVVSWKELDPRAKGGDASSPFRILSLANSADAEGTLTPRKACLFGRKSVHKSGCFRASRSWNMIIGLRAMENRSVSGDKFW